MQFTRFDRTLQSKVGSSRFGTLGVGTVRSDKHA